ncbi:MAG: adenylate/guanylate cyclase domain-containing protein [Rhodospirillaceae bacterium]
MPATVTTIMRGWDAPSVRAWLRLTSALVMVTFVVCHLINHSLLLVSLALANGARPFLVGVWETAGGGCLLALAALLHYSNALWSIYRRCHLRLTRGEWWQLGLGLTIPILLMMHVIGTRLASELLRVNHDYSSVLLMLWMVMPLLGATQAAALLTVWTHACIGLRFWLQTKRWYPDWRGGLLVVAVLLPTLALSGFVAAGNQVRRQAEQAPDYAGAILDDANLTESTRTNIYRMAAWGWGGHLVLVLLPFAGRALRHWGYRLARPPRLEHAGGKVMALLPGASVLETLRAGGIAHAAVCGGRGRCTTCRVRVTRGLEHLPPPSVLEAAALARIQAPPGLRLACQLYPTADLAVTPLLPAHATAGEGRLRGGLEGSERPVTVVFVDLRDSTSLGEARLPYDVLFVLNQFFSEMNAALVATGGHYSQFTGDGLMALYGLDDRDPGDGVRAALRGAREMMIRLAQLNHHLQGELARPLRIGIGIHCAEAIVGEMGPPRSHILTAIGDTVNTAARLESLTKDYNCTVVLSLRAAVVAGLDMSGQRPNEATVKGRVQTVEFYALNEIPPIQ